MEKVPECKDGLKPLGLPKDLVCPENLSPEEFQEVLFTIVSKRECSGCVTSHQIQQEVKKVFGVDVDLNYVYLGSDLEKNTKKVADLVWNAMYPEDA